MPIQIPQPNFARPVPPYGGGNPFMQYMMRLFTNRPQQQPQNSAPIPRPGMPYRMGASAAQTTPTETPMGEGQTPYNQSGYSPTPPPGGWKTKVPNGAIVHGVAANGEPLWSFPHPGAIIHLAHPDAYHGQGPMNAAQAARISAARPKG